MKALELFLGILTAMGGFVEIGELTFTVTAGAKFGYSLLWVVVIGTIGIIVYGEMAGRVAAVTGQPVFTLIRERDGFAMGAVTLVAAFAVTFLTCAAEIGGIALVWQLLADWPYRAAVVAAGIALIVVVWVLPFEWLERVFGLGGLMLVVFMVVAVREAGDWGEVAAALVPNLPPFESAAEARLYAFYAVALLSSILLPYETYFYASGAIEDKWKPGDVPLNRVIVAVGFALGALLAVSLVVVGTRYHGSRGVEPDVPGIVALAAAASLGKAGLLLALGGMLFAFAGAAIETSLSGAYGIAQFFGWPWGRFRRPREAARFSVAWVATFALATLVVLTGVDPVKLVEYSIVFSVAILPLSYFPLLVVANDRRVMGRYANGVAMRWIGAGYLTLVTVAALAAIPLLVATHGGQG